MNHLFILNPTAGGGRKTEEMREIIRSCMRKRNDAWEIYETKEPLDATETVRRIVSTGEDILIIACGGDGTLNECVNGVYGYKNAALTHFPAGTGNDFIKTFPSKEMFFDLPQLLDGEVISRDIFDLGTRVGINISSVGFDAAIAADVHRYSRIPLIGGKTAYIVSLLRNVIAGIGTEFCVEVNGETIRQSFTLICACNGRHYGGAFTPVPEADPADGLMDILLVDRVSRRRVLSLVKTYARGGYQELPEIIRHIRTDRITIRRDGAFSVNIDGEIIQKEGITIQLIPKAIRFLLPKTKAY